MKNLMHKRIGFWSLLLVIFLSSTAVILATVTNLWREISEQQAKKQSLNIPSWAPLIERAQPAVVVVKTEALVEQAPVEIPGPPGPFRFFIPAPPEHQRGQGSGFIINEDGYFLTNQHVIDGAQRIKVTVGMNTREYDAILIGFDELLDIALLKIKTEENEKIKWPFLPLGDSDKLRLGDNVLALGSPLGLVQSVSVGIVAHLHRADMVTGNRFIETDLIQLGISFNPGNSGGPVLDDPGRVMCIGQSYTPAGQSIGFCLPINNIKSVIPQLLSNGRVERAYLGVDPVNLTEETAKKLGLSSQEGALILQVMPNTPADKAGLRAGDVILEIDDQKVPSSSFLRQKAAHKPIGQNVKLKVYRAGTYKIINVKVERRPGKTAQLVRPDIDKVTAVSIDSLGLEVADTNEQLRQELGLPATNAGAQIVRVARGSSAEFRELKPNDVITTVDGIPIMSASQLKTLIDNADREKTFMLMTRRGNNEILVPIDNLKSLPPLLRR